MSNTNLTGKKRSIVTWTIFTTQQKEIGKVQKPGESINSINDNRLKVVAGQQPMEISANNIRINEEGQRSNGIKRKDMKNMDYKRNRMRKINKEKLKEKSTGNKNPEANEHEI